MARGGVGPLRLGFQGVADTQLMAAVTAFGTADRGRSAELVEIPFSDPFGALRRGAVDAAVVLLPAEEPDLPRSGVLAAAADGGRLPPPSPHRTGPGRRRRGRGRTADRPGPARTAVLADRARPGTLPGPSTTTLQGALSLAAAGRGALGLVWQREAETETVGEFARVLAGAAAVREDR
ncbi:hypothetical protein [Streptomyces sp. NPDC002550]